MATAVIALVWLGMLIGVSFLATPVKFVVQDLTLPVALQVGQATFGLFARVEWVLSALLLPAAWFSRRRRVLALTLALLIAAAVGLQALWLLPVLDARVDIIVAGGSPPASPHHAIYAGLEAGKALALAALALIALWRIHLKPRSKYAPHIA